MNFITADTTRMVIKADGNVGIGVTPDTFSSGYTALQLNGYAYNISHSGGDHYITNNAYFNSGWKYGQTSTAQKVELASGRISLMTAVSGSADAAITWTTGLVQASDGKVGIGTSSPTGKLEVQGTAIGSGVVDVDYFKALKLSIPDGTEWGSQAQFSVGRWQESGSHARSSLVISLGHGTQNSDSDADTDVMTMLSSGTVGIGTTTPAHKLSIGKAGSSIHLGYNGTAANYEVGRITSNSYDVDNTSYSLAEMNFMTTSANGYTGEILFRTNSVNSTNSRAAERLRIGTAGQIGIGGANYGTDGQVLTSTGTGSAPAWEDAGGGGAYSSWLVKTANFTCAAGDQLVCNHATTAFTITLPSGTTVGRTVIISNIGAATVTVGRNSQPINSTASDATLLTNRSTQLVYVDSTIGWKELP